MTEGSKLLTKQKGKNISPNRIEGNHHSMQVRREQPLRFRKWR